MLHVACSTDERFAPDCAVMLRSLAGTHGGDGLHVHLLHDESLSPGSVAAMGEIVTRAGACFNAVTGTGRAAELAASERFPVRAWFRVLYIDADTLITSRLEPLWNHDLAGGLLGAVTNPLLADMVPRVRTELGLPDGGAYFNSGVLLIDLEAWRAEQVTEATLRFAAGHPGLPWPDQDALNAVLHARRVALHPRWNAMPGIWEIPGRLLPYTPDEVAEARADPAVVHFVGPHKPWHYRSRHPYRAAYFRELDATPWRGRPVEGRSAGQAILRALPPLWALRIELALPGWQDGARGAWWRLRARAGRLRARARVR